MAIDRRPRPWLRTAIGLWPGCRLRRTPQTRPRRPGQLAAVGRVARIPRIPPAGWARPDLGARLWSWPASVLPGVSGPGWPGRRPSPPTPRRGLAGAGRAGPNAIPRGTGPELARPGPRQRPAVPNRYSPG